MNQRKQLKITLFCTLGVLIVIVVMGLLLYENGMETDLGRKNQSPSLEALFGTDWLGRDMFARTLSGLSVSILIGTLAAGVSALIALLLGILAALGGKKVDRMISFLIDTILGIPHILLLILISYAMGKGLKGVVVGIALTHWPTLARVIRGEMLQLRQSQYIKVAARLGKSPFWIARKHMIPHLLPHFMVGLVLMFPHAILHEASITFLGFGLPPEQPAIGVILSESMGYLMTGNWWLAVLPGSLLVGVVILFDCLGNAWNRLLEPTSTHL